MDGLMDTISLDKSCRYFCQWRRQGWCIIGTGLVDGAASLWPIKRTVPTDGTRYEQGLSATQLMVAIISPLNRLEHFMD